MLQLVRYNWFPCLLFLLTTLVIGYNINSPVSASGISKKWEAPDINQLPFDEAGNQIRYGKELIINTSYYLGPKGKVAAITNGMNCQNCHIEAGTRLFGNCFSAVASSYPVYRPRSGRVESIEFRINDCLLRSLNGKTIDSNSTEMKAMVAYLKWVGQNVPKGTKPEGAGTKELAFLGRAADPAKGKIVYQSNCIRCHGSNGEGLPEFDSSSFIYPPLWGENSFNSAAGMFRISKLAGFIKCNMPYGTTYDEPKLTDEEAWDVAAFIVSQPRPEKNFTEDWPELKKKAFDIPFGPYTDNFSEQQHKYGPFQPILNSRK